MPDEVAPRPAEPGAPGMMPCARVAAVALCLLCGTAGRSLAAPGDFSWRGAYEAGAAHLEAGELEEALERLRLAALVHPLDAAVRAALARARQRLQLELLEAARRFLSEKSIRQAAPRLVKAAAIELDGASRDEILRLLRRLGYAAYGGGWHHREEIVALEKRAQRIARNRRRELELPDRFVLHRRAGVRLFTDLDLARQPLDVGRCLTDLERAVAAYRRLFLPFPLDPQWDGLDIVIFKQREDYSRRGGAADTVGIFLPARRASFFSFGPDAALRDPATARVLLHEVCHQLDYKLLRMTHPPPWLQEGLALLFEGLRSEAPDGEVLRGLGRDTWRHLRRVCPPRSPRWLGLERLVALEDLGPLHGTTRVHDFYAQAGALVQFLLVDLEGEPPSPARRAFFYRLVVAARKEGAAPRTALADFRQLVAEVGWDLEDVEKNLVNALQRMSE